MESSGLKASSASTYESAIRTILNPLVKAKGILSTSLLDIPTWEVFKSVNEQLSIDNDYVKMNIDNNNKYHSAMIWLSRFIDKYVSESESGDVVSILRDTSVTDTERQSQVSIRLGQGEFRQKLILLWGECAVTGFKEVSLLVASHIKPWRDSSPTERLDKCNGFLLLPNIDKSFDSGFISFESNGQILISRELASPECLGIDMSMKINLFSGHQGYLAHHREHVFRGV